MNRILRALSRRLMGLRSSREDIEALDEAISARRRGTLPVGELRARHRSEVSGVLRAEGMVVAGRTRPTIYNPSYEILAPGA